MNTPENWIDVGAADALPIDDVRRVEAGDLELALCTVGDAVYAVDDLCTHGQARLSDGFLDGHELECPLHQGRFDVRDGSARCAPVTEGLRCHPVRVDGGRVWVKRG